MSKIGKLEPKMLATVPEGTNDLCIEMYGEVGCYGITLEWLSNAVNLQVQPVSSLYIKLYSPGGDFTEGMAIYHYLRGLGIPTTCEILGYCASAATLIASGCDNVLIPASATYLIHEVSVPYTGGSADDMAQIASFMNTLNNTAAEVYAARTMLPIEQIQNMMAIETIMSGTVATSMGFCNQVILDGTSADTGNEDSDASVVSDSDDQDVVVDDADEDATDDDTDDADDSDDDDDDDNGLDLAVLNAMMVDVEKARIHAIKSYKMQAKEHAAANEVGDKPAEATKASADSQPKLSQRVAPTNASAASIEQAEASDESARPSKVVLSTHESDDGNEQGTVLDILEAAGGDIELAREAVRHTKASCDATAFMNKRKKVRDFYNKAKKMCPDLPLSSGDFEGVVDISAANEIIMNALVLRSEASQIKVDHHENKTHQSATDMVGNTAQFRIGKSRFF